MDLRDLFAFIQKRLDERGIKIKALGSVAFSGMTRLGRTPRDLDIYSEELDKLALQQEIRKIAEELGWSDLRVDSFFPYLSPLYVKVFRVLNDRSEESARKHAQDLLAVYKTWKLQKKRGVERFYEDDLVWTLFKDMKTDLGMFNAFFEEEEFPHALRKFKQRFVGLLKEKHREEAVEAANLIEDLFLRAYHLYRSEREPRIRLERKAP